MLHQTESGERYISLKWCLSFLAALLLTGIGAWIGQRHQVEADLMARLLVVERTQARVLERLDANAETLSKIYTEIREHRTSGK